MWNWITHNDTLHLIGAFVVILFIGGFALKSLGFLHIGKKPCHIGDRCPDPKCQGCVEQTASDLAEHKKDFKNFKEDVYPKINGTAEAVARIEGFLNGTKGNI